MIAHGDSSRSRRISQAAASMLIGTVLAGASALAAPAIVEHPGDGYPTIQVAVEVAGCEGTVLLAAGVYNERVLAPCGLRLIGAGIDSTILDGTDLAEPFISPVVGFGGSPFVPDAFTEGYELAGMTIRAGKNAPPLGVGMAWTNLVELHDLEIVGFSRGIAVATSKGGSIHDVTVQGPGSNPHRFGNARCIVLFELGFALDALPHMSGWNIHDNSLMDCGVGLDLQNNVDATVSHNIIQRTWIGLNLLGTSNVSVEHNFIARSEGPKAFGFPPAGMSLTNANDSSIHHNTLCMSEAGIRYDGLGPDAFGFPPSSNNQIHHNIFSNNGEDIGFNDPLLGPGNTEFENVNEPALDCAP